MNENRPRTGEILFVKSVKDGIPNRDPLRDSDARRLFGEDDGRISLSDVSLKRDVRDYVLARHSDGGADKTLFVFVRKERTADNKLLGREKLVNTLLDRSGRTPGKGDDIQSALMASSFDARVFGAVFSVKKSSFSQCGPVQFGWAHSLHPVETRYVQGTVVMPSSDVTISDSGETTGGATQGTIWTAYTLPFALFAMPAVVNAQIAQDTGMTATDVELLLEALWRGTQIRQARGRGRQEPLLLLHVEYSDPFFRIGFLEEGVELDPPRDAWVGSRPPTSLGEVTLKVGALGELLRKNTHKIARCRVSVNPQLRVEGDLPAEPTIWGD